MPYAASADRGDGTMVSCKRHGRGLPLVAVAVLAALSMPAWAGDGEFEAENEEELGAAFFGEARSLAGLQPLADVRIRAVVRGSAISVNTSTDEDGRFRLRGFGKEAAPDTIVVSCSRAGYVQVEVIRRSMPGGRHPRIEVECLMEKK